MPKFLIGIDIGTTLVKAVLITDCCEKLASWEIEYPIYHPHAGWAEQNADDWWNASVTVLSKIASEAKKMGGEISALYISSQTPTMLPLDEHGTPIRNAMIWMDRRAEKEVRFVTDKVGFERYRQIIKKPPDASGMLHKFLWYKNNEPDNYKKTKKILMTNTYVIYKLTGKMVCDHGSASLVQAFDEELQCWSEEVAGAVDVPLADYFPPILNALDIAGETNKEASEKTGLPAGIPVFTGSTDVVPGSVATGIYKPGQAAETTGTSTLVFFASNKKVIEGRGFLTQEYYAEAVPTVLFGAINSTGASLKWYATKLGQAESIAADIEGASVYEIASRLAGKALPGSGGLIFFPYMMGERTPIYNSTLRGMLIGLSLSTSKREIVRAILEGTSFAVRHVTDEFRKFGKNEGLDTDIKGFNSSGGGANSDTWLQIKASMLKCPVTVFEDMGGVPFGSAVLAGLGVGIFKNLGDTITQYQRIKKVIDPVEEWSRVYDDLYPLFLRMRENIENDLRELYALTTSSLSSKNDEV